MQAQISRRHRKFTSRCSFIPEPLESRTLLSGFGTVDAFPEAGGGAPFAMTADSAGNVYAAGFINTGTNNNILDAGVVREKSAGSTTWTTIEQYKYTDGKGANFHGVAVDAAGDLFVSGGSTSNHWLVLERPADKSTFSLIDDVAPVNTKTTSSSGFGWRVGADGAGNVFAVGQISTSTTNRGVTTNTSNWTVREMASGKSAFTTVDSFAGAYNRADSITSIASGPNAGIYVAGELTGGSSYVWGVRKSTNGGATWTTVDTTNFTSIATRTVADPSGNLYVVGEGVSSGTFYHWLVRESTDGGASWSTVDDYQLASATGALAASADTAGNIYVVGNGKDSSNVDHSIVRSNAGGTWHTIDDYQLAAGKNTYGDSGTVDPAGNVYVSGEAIDATGGFHWYVRELPLLTASIAPPTESGAVYSTTITFDRAVGGFDLSDLTLTTPGGTISGSDLAADGATLTTIDNINYVLTLPVSLTGDAGAYELTLTAAGSAIADANLLPLTANAWVVWTE